MKYMLEILLHLKIKAFGNPECKKKDRLVAINGSEIDTTYALLDYMKLSKANDGKIDAITKKTNLNNLMTLNPVFEENEIIPDGVAVLLPKVKVENPIKINNNVLKARSK